MEGKREIKFDKYNSQAIKGIAIVMMLFHHMYLSTDRFEGLNVAFTPFTAERIMYLCRTFKICVPIYAFISGYGLYLSYRKNHSTPGEWTAKRLIKTMGGFWIIWVLSVVILQLHNGYATTRYFGNGNIARGVAAMGLDFLGLAKLFGTSTLNGTWWYTSAAIIFIICVPLFMIKEEYLVLILVAVAAFPRTISLEVMGVTGVYAFLPVFLMGMCAAKYDLFNRWFRVWNDGAKHVLKFFLELLALYVLYKAYRRLPLMVYSEIHWGLYPIVFMAFCCEFINVIPGIRQVLLFLGKHSMNIFLIHTFIRQSSFVYVSGYFLTNTLTLLLASLAISVVLEWLKKVTGYNRLIQNICAKIG